MSILKKINLKQSLLISGIILIAIIIFINIKPSYSGEVTHINFKSNDITIEGVLVKPNGKGPFPAIILLQGAGGSHQGYDKWYNRLHTNEFVSKGFAVLSYTKRGSGSNNVNYRYVSFKDLTNDGVNAVNFLRRQPDINPNKIGLLGISESGWFSPEIAAKSGNISFIINRVSPPLTVHETTLHEIRMDALNDGFTDIEIDETIIPLITRIRKFYVAVYKDETLANSKERDNINAIYAELQKKEKFKDYFGKQLPPYDKKWYQKLGYKYSYNPQLFLKKLNIPILFIYGGKDINIPSKKCMEFLEEFRSEYQNEITIKLYPNAGHYLYQWDFLPIEGLYEPGYLNLLGSWAKKQISQ